MPDTDPHDALAEVAQGVQDRDLLPDLCRQVHARKHRRVVIAGTAAAAVAAAGVVLGRHVAGGSSGANGTTEEVVALPPADASPVIVVTDYIRALNAHQTTIADGFYDPRLRK